MKVAEHIRKNPAGAKDVEQEIRLKMKTLPPMAAQSRVEYEESDRFTGIIDRSLKGHAALLGDARLSHPANIGQKAHIVSQLQQNYGNAYVQRVVGHIQAKSDEKLLDEELPNDIEDMINAEKGSGQLLEPETRSEMEAAFSHDFGTVRVHTDATADKLTEELGAKAFTTDRDIFFRQGTYDPGSKSGKRLIGHELTHVVQQDKGRATGSSTTSREVTADTALETEADKAAVAVTKGKNFRIEQAVRWGRLQGSWFGEVWGWIRARVEGEAYIEKKAKELHESLERAHTLTSIAEGVAAESDIKARLGRARDALNKVNEPLGRYLNVKDKIRNVVRVIDAVKDFAAANPSKDAEQFARAAGSLFAAVGELGQELPVAGVYFKLLSEMGNFFVNMRHMLDPGLRWRRRPEAKYLP